MTDLQKEKLYSIGLDLQIPKNESSWRQHYDEAMKFYQQYGTLSIPKRYAGNNGRNLGVWLQHQREGKRSGRLADWQITMLDHIGMIWEFENPWIVGYRHAEEYWKEHRHLMVPNTYLCEDGYRLGKWISNQRSAYHKSAKKELNTEQIAKLNAIGMVWSAKPGRGKVCR